MKTCIVCGGRLGLGVRFTNVWRVFSWEHVRFCSSFCEHNWHLEYRQEQNRRRWLGYLRPG
jgi:hypothetical protein